MLHFQMQELGQPPKEIVGEMVYCFLYFIDI